MSGLIPYVDFADSKGPLLWLFYGLGNMLDPTGWNGTLLLFMVYYVFVLRMVWLSGRLMLGSERGAAFVVIAMSVAYWGIGHVENRIWRSCRSHISFTWSLRLMPVCV